MGRRRAGGRYPGSPDESYLDQGGGEQEIVKGTLRRRAEYEGTLDREAWRAAVHGVAKSLTRLSN